jgi:hyperosmotically inducible protein
MWLSKTLLGAETPNEKSAPRAFASVELRDSGMNFEPERRFIRKHLLRAETPLIAPSHCGGPFFRKCGDAQVATSPRGKTAIQMLLSPKKRTELSPIPGHTAVARSLTGPLSLQTTKQPNRTKQHSILLMRIRKMRAVVISLLLTGGYIVGNNALAQPERTMGELVDDTTISTRVKAALVRAANVPGGSINVEVHQGNVQLAAFLESDDQIETALSIARSIEGVTAVRNSMVEISGKRSVGTAIDDQVIHGRLEAALVDNIGLASSVAINTEVHHSNVLLSGFVFEEATKRQAETIARNVAGVTEVFNRIDVMGNDLSNQQIQGF